MSEYKAINIINKPVVSIYKKPDDTSELIDEILFGMKITVLKFEDDYAFIETFYNYKGYIKKDCFEKLNNGYDVDNYFIKSQFVDILKEPNIKSNILITVPKGSHIKLLNNHTENNGYLKVLLPNYNFGFVNKNHIQKISFEYPKNEDYFRDNLIKDAFEYMHVQYRWGGKTHLGIDCSGLCFMIYLLNGVIIPRDTNIKDENLLKEIDFKDVKRGDLLYFPGHIAMYIGENKYIHSSIKGNGVKINSLNKNDFDYREDLAHDIIKICTIF